MFPDIGFKDCDIELVRRLKKDLLISKNYLLNYSPSNFTKRRLDKIRIRVFKFPKNEECNEFFLIYKNRKYVCLNSSLLKRRYYAALQHVLHGLTHHFSQFRDDIGDEVFCEFVSYSVLKDLLRERSKRFQDRILRSVMRSSPKEYNTYYRFSRKMDEKNKGFLIKLNNMVKNRKISIKKEKRLFKRVLKTKNKGESFSIENIPELERGFRKV
ncbi:MAG: hypothetical protein QXY45_03080 [Candidatus Aenigmatarchaeota archaeon]